MNKNNGFDLLNTITGNMSAEDIMLAGLQGLIAAKIATKRQEMGMTQKNFAKLMEVSQSLVSRWERGEDNFTLETLVKIASKLNLEIQCPFVLNSAPVYYTSQNIIQFPRSYRSSGRSPTSEKYIDVKEM